MAIDDGLDRALLAPVETVSDFLVAVEPVPEQRARGRGHSGPTLLAPAFNLALQRCGQRQLRDVLDLAPEVPDPRCPWHKWDSTRRSRNRPMEPEQRQWCVAVIGFVGPLPSGGSPAHQRGS